MQSYSEKGYRGLFMDERVCTEFKLGRRLLGRLPHGKDLITSIEDFCTASDIQLATFTVTRVVSSATLSVYDQKQHVRLCHFF